MFIAGYFLQAVGVVLSVVLNIYMWIMIAHVILSWVSPDPYNPIVRFINNVTEPLLFRIRQKLPTAYGGIDFSPMIVLLVILFLQNFVVNSLMTMAYRMTGG